MKSAADKLDDKAVSLELERILSQLEEMNLITDTVRKMLYFCFVLIL